VRAAGISSIARRDSRSAGEGRRGVVGAGSGAIHPGAAGKAMPEVAVAAAG